MTSPEISPESLLSSRDKILETAEALFAQRGYAGVGLREVAERVGLGKSSLFHHFPTKVHLYVAVLERVLALIEARLARALLTGGSPGERLERWTSAMVDVLAECPTRAPLLLRAFHEAEVVGDEARARLTPVMSGLLGGISELLEDGIRSGQFRPVSIPHALQTLIGLTIYHFASGGFGDEVLGQPIYSALEVRRRKEEVRSFLAAGLAPRRD